MINEILLYQSNELPERIEVRIEDDSVWLNRQQLALLFGRDIKTIGKHIANVFLESELVKNSTVANYATIQIYIEFIGMKFSIGTGYLKFCANHFKKTN